MAKRKRAPKSTVRHLTTRVNASGSVRYYWQPAPSLRRAGFRVIRLADDRVQAVSEAEALNRKVDTWRRGEDGNRGPRKGTVLAMIADYRQSRFYRRLAPKTTSGYERYLTVIEKWAGDQPVIAIGKPDVETLYASHLATGKVATANALMRVVQALWEGRGKPRPRRPGA